MFESIAASLLTRFLGDFIEDLDRHQLSISVWDGDVVLENLTLKRTALEKLKLPIQVVFGKLGKLVVKIPWSSIYSEPVIVEIEHLFLVTLPTYEIPYEPQFEAKYAEEVKKAELRRYEETRRKQRLKEENKTDDSFKEKLALQIVKNVLINISKIHFRYEDKLSNPELPFALGITLGNLKVQTTDQNWEPQIIKEVTTQIYKTIHLNGFGVYWNPNTTLHESLDTKNLSNILIAGIATSDKILESYNYILGPIKSEIKLSLNAKPEKDIPPFSIPMILVDMELQKLLVELGTLQMLDLTLLVESLIFMRKGLPYRKFRTPELGDSSGNKARARWKFAYTCILETDIKRRRLNWNWEHMKEHRRLCKEYARVYKEKLMNIKSPPIIAEIVYELESKLNICNIIIVRQTVEMEIEREAREKVAQSSKGWIASLWGGSSDTSTTIQLKNVRKNLTPEEKEKLYKAIDYQENSAPTEFPEDYLASSFGLFMKNFEFKLLDNNLSKMFYTKINDIDFKLSRKPSQSGTLANMQVDKLIIHGFKREDIQPCLLEGKPFLDVLIETNSGGSLVTIKTLSFSDLYIKFSDYLVAHFETERVGTTCNSHCTSKSECRS